MDFVDSAGKLSEGGIVVILVSFILLILFGVGMTIRYVAKRLFDEQTGIISFWVVNWVKTNIESTKALPIAINDNAIAVRKVGSDVVKISRQLEAGSKEFRNMRIVARRQTHILVELAEAAGKGPQVMEHVSKIEQILDGENEDA